jgi:hypothetical protein
MSRSPLQSQQHRWRTATKRQILGNFNSQSNSPIAVDGSNSEHVKMVIKDLQQTYDQMLLSLRSELENFKLEQEETLSTGLIKLPKAVRNMTVKEFNEQHACDLLALFKSKDGVVVANKGQLGKKRDYQHSVMETPAQRVKRQDALATAIRTARRGEGLL